MNVTNWEVYEKVLRQYPSMDVNGAMRLLNGRIESGTTTLLTDMECERLFAFALAHVIVNMSSEQSWTTFLDSFTSAVEGVVTRERATAGLLLVLLTENNQRWAIHGPLADLQRVANVTEACVVVFDRGPIQFVTLSYTW